MRLVYKSRYLFLAIFVASFLVGDFVSALDFGPLKSNVLDLVSWLIYGVTMMIGKLLGVFVEIFLNVIQYNKKIKTFKIIKN